MIHILPKEGSGIKPAAVHSQIYQALIEAELTETIGATPHERTDARTAQRNGHRTRTLSTTAGDLELRIPKPRTGSFFPSLSRAATAGGPGVVRSRDGRLPARGVHPQGRRPGQSPRRRQRYPQLAGVADLRRS